MAFKSHFRRNAPGVRKKTKDNCDSEEHTGVCGFIRKTSKARRFGHGNTTNYSSPKQVGSLTNWSLLAWDSMSAVTLKTDGTLWTWGNGGVGRLGLGNTTSYSSPKQVGSLTSWKAITCAGYGSGLAFYEP